MSPDRGTRPPGIRIGLLTLGVLLLGVPATVRPAPAEAPRSAAERRAQAERRHRARELTREATEHYRLGRFEAALAAYRAAYRAAPAPALLFNMGQCYRQLGDHAEAIHLISGYLREQPRARNRRLAASLIVESCTELAARQRAGGPAAAGERPFYRRWWFWTAVGAIGGGATLMILRDGPGGDGAQARGKPR